MLLSIPCYSSENLTFPVQFTFVGENHIQEPTISPKGDEFFRYILCKTGAGEIVINGVRSYLAADQCCIIPAGSSFSYEGKCGEWIVDMIIIKMNHGMFSGMNIINAGIYTLKDNSVFHRYIRQVLDEKNENPETRQRKLSVLAYAFLLELSQVLTIVIEKESESYSESKKTGRMISYLEEHYAESFSLDEMAKELNVSKSYMCALFKEKTGRTLIYYLTSIRIGHARFYLEKYPDMPVREVGIRCGFENPSYFGKKFKEFTSMTPESYRMGAFIGVG